MTFSKTAILVLLLSFFAVIKSANAITDFSSSDSFVDDHNDQQQQRTPPPHHFDKKAFAVNYITPMITKKQDLDAKAEKITTTRLQMLHEMPDVPVDLVLVRAYTKLDPLTQQYEAHYGKILQTFDRTNFTQAHSPYKELQHKVRLFRKDTTLLELTLFHIQTRLDFTLALAPKKKLDESKKSFLKLLQSFTEDTLTVANVYLEQYQNGTESVPLSQGWRLLADSWMDSSLSLVSSILTRTDWKVEAYKSLTLGLLLGQKTQRMLNPSYSKTVISLPNHVVVTDLLIALDDK